MKTIIAEGPTAALNAEDRAILDTVESTLDQGIALKRWWEQKQAANGYAERFQVVRQFNPSSSSFGFYDVADLPGITIPINGIVDDMLFDNRKVASNADVWVKEFREFVLHYFLRVSDFRQPAAFTDRRTFTPPGYLNNFSWCPKRQTGLAGFGFSQHYYKLRKTGEMGKFPAHQEYRIADLRDIGEVYEWLVLKVRIYDFNLTLDLPGKFDLRVNVPLREETYLVISKDFVVNENRPESGITARFGFGYVFLKNPRATDYAFGPGEFAAAFELIHFSLLENGETRVQTVFVENRPDRILSISVDPVQLSLRLADFFSLGLASTMLGPMKPLFERAPFHFMDVDPVSLYISLANWLTEGEAKDDLCLSKEFLERAFLLQHYMQHYQMLTGALLTWRRVANWLDRSTVPQWVIEGTGRPTP